MKIKATLAIPFRDKYYKVVPVKLVSKDGVKMWEASYIDMADAKSVLSGYSTLGLRRTWFHDERNFKVYFNYYPSDMDLIFPTSQSSTP